MSNNPVWPSALIGALLLGACGGGGGGGGATGSPSTPPAQQSGATPLVFTNGVYPSADGRYLGFEAGVGGYPYSNIVVYDRQTRIQRVIGVSPSGTPANAPVHTPRLSPDARYVLFTSKATNLVSGIAYPTNSGGIPYFQVFVRDLVTNTTSLASATSSGTSAANADINGDFVLSRNGRYVAFSTEATNLVTGIAHHGGSNIYLRDLQAGTTELISISSDGLSTGKNNAIIVGGADNHSWYPAISDDGRYVAYLSAAMNLVVGVSYGATPSESYGNVFRRDRTLSVTQLVSISSDGSQAAYGNSFLPTLQPMKGRYMSGDGNVIAFSSTATNFAPSGTTGPFNQMNVFVREMSSPAPQIISIGVLGVAADGWSQPPVVSHDGTHVAFGSAATNLVTDNVTYWTAGPGGPVYPNIFRWRKATDTIILVSKSSDGTQAGDFESHFPEISDDGSVVVFSGGATTLSDSPVVPLTFTQHQDNIYIWQESLGKVELVSQRNGQALGSINPEFAISDDGKVIGFRWLANFGSTGYFNVF